MSSRLRHFASVAVLATLLVGLSKPSLTQDFVVAEDLHRWCLEAKHGEFEPVSAASLAPAQISFLIDCTILPPAPPPGGFSREIASEASIATAKKRADKRIAAQQVQRIKIADTLLTHEFNPNFISNLGSPLIATMVVSDFPVEWKVRVITLMIEQGADPTVKNPYGLTALDLAKHHKQQKIVELLLRQPAN